MFYMCLLDSKPIVEGFTDSAPPCGKLSLQLEKNIVVSSFIKELKIYNYNISLL